MAMCETLPLTPDVVLDEETQSHVTEPVEVGPYTQGVVFVKLLERKGEASLRVQIGISPSGYNDWDEQWVVLKELTDFEVARMHAAQIANFGNWLRLRLVLDDVSSNDEVTVLGWFTGKG